MNDVGHKYPIYVPTKGRSEYLYTIKNLMRMGARFYAIVEEQEYSDYSKVVPKENILILDKAFQKEYETCDGLGESRSKGSGPARNFAWEHAKQAGFPWHWVMDDNILSFRIFDRNRQLKIYNSSFFRVMENFVERYSNIGMAGPQYYMFTPRKVRKNYFSLNTRIYSCNLIRTDLKFRWRGRWNEDTILSLDMLTNGWCTVMFNVFLQEKMTTQTIPGGNTADVYKYGTAEKSRMLYNVYPQYTRKVYRFHRPHHLVNFSAFNQRLVRKRDYDQIVAAQPKIEFKVQRFGSTSEYE